MSKPLFEHTSCSRCGGSGNYSFNLMHGTRCFGCGGSGFKLTKRGRAAQDYLDGMRDVLAGEFKEGDLILSQGFSAGSFSMKSKWERVTKVEVITGKEAGYVNSPDIQCVRITTETGGMVGFLDSKYRKGFSAEEKTEQRNAALAYQETLTKAGTPRKRA